MKFGKCCMAPHEGKREEAVVKGDEKHERWHPLQRLSRPGGVECLLLVDRVGVCVEMLQLHGVDVDVLLWRV